jgi:phosphoglycerol transferase MdoB-like AlkP superfamily enzyme
MALTPEKEAIAAAFLIPTVIIGYALGCMHIEPNFVGVLDHLLFVLIFFLILNFILSVSHPFVRIVGSLTFVLAMSLFFLSNTIYYRFFNAWGHLDTAKQWKDVPSLGMAILSLPTGIDMIMHLLVPIFLWIFALHSFVRLSFKSTALLITLIVGVLFGHQNLASSKLTYIESNPLFYMIREKSLEMSLSSGYVSKKPITRDLARYQLINHSLYESAGSDRYPFLKKPKPDAPALPYALKNKPNVVLVLMESIRAYEVGAYGAQPSLMPNLDRLAKEGILFKNFYALGTQTIRGEFTILSSYNPNVLGGPVYVNNPNLSVDTLPSILKKQGYATLWIEAACGFVEQKMNFLLKHGVDRCYTNVPIKRPPLGLGARDEDTFEFALNLFEQKKQPFFAEIMTLSNHWKFDSDYPTIPKTPKVRGNADYVNYSRGIYYADYALGKFFDAVRKSKLYDNTVFILTGDHGIWYFPDQITTTNEVWKKELYFRNPCIIWSPKLLKPQVIETLASQLDIAPTLLDLLNIQVTNSFMGTSVLRDDTDTRFIFPIQDGRWNFRVGNSYIYDSGPGIFASLPPFNLKEYMTKIHGKPQTHAAFTTDADFLQSWDPAQIHPLEPTAMQKLKNFAEDALDAYHNVICQNRITPPAAAAAPTVSARK